MTDYIEPALQVRRETRSQRLQANVLLLMDYVAPSLKLLVRTKIFTF